MSTSPDGIARYIRMLGKGPQGTRSLTIDDACDAMRLILDRHVTPEQLGAFLMLMRVKTETAEELAGLAKACRAYIASHNPEAESLSVDLDWPSYAGKRRQLPWFFLAILLLARSGVSILVHGSKGQEPGRIYLEDVLPLFDIPVCNGWEQVDQQLKARRFAYIGLDSFAPYLQQLMGLKKILGLRSPVHSVVRMLNPLNASVSLHGVFHPPYLALHAEAAALLHDASVVVMKGDGGECEVNPDLDCRTVFLRDGQVNAFDWPRRFDEEFRHGRDLEMNIRRLHEVWLGQSSDEYGQAAVIATVALALQSLGRLETLDLAYAQAAQLWEHRLAPIVPGAL